MAKGQKDSQKQKPAQSGIEELNAFADSFAKESPNEEQQGKIPDSQRKATAENGASELDAFAEGLKKKEPSGTALPTSGSTAPGQPVNYVSPSVGGSNDFLGGIITPKNEQTAQPVVANTQTSAQRTVDRKQQAVDFIKNDYTRNKSRLDASFTSPTGNPEMPGQVISLMDNRFLDQVVNDNQDGTFLRRYRNQRVSDIEAERDQKKVEMAQRYAQDNKAIAGPLDITSVFQKVLSNVDARKEAAAIDDQYQAEIDKIDNAVRDLASIQVVNQNLRTRKPGEKIDPEKIGKDLRKVMGDPTLDKEERLSLKGIENSPQSRYNNDALGYVAINRALNDEATKENPNVQKVAQLYELAEDANEKLLTKHNDFRREQVARAISDEIYNGKSWFETATGAYKISDNDIKSAAERLGIPADYYNDIESGDLRTANVFGTLVNELAAKPGAAIGSMIMRPLRKYVMGDDPDTVDWYYDNLKKDYTTFFANEPEAQQFIRPEVGVQLNKNKSNYLSNVPVTNDGMFNWSPGSISNLISSGIGQISGYATGATTIGKGLQGLNLVNDYNRARAAGTVAYAFATTFDDNYRAADQVIKSDTPDSEKAKMLYATIRSLTTGATELILPDYKIADRVLSPFTLSAKEFVDEVAEKGIGVLTREGVGKFIKRGLKQAAKGTAQEVSEEAIDNIADFVTGSMFNPSSVQSRNLADELKKTVVATALTTALPVGGGSFRATTNRFSKYLMYMVGAEAESFRIALQEGVEDGFLTQQEANDRLKVVNTMANVVSSIPDRNIETGQELNSYDKIEYANNLFQEALVKTKMKGINDQVQIDEFNKVLDQLKAERQNIYDNANEVSRNDFGEPVFENDVQSQNVSTNTPVQPENTKEEYDKLLKAYFDDRVYDDQGDEVLKPSPDSSINTVGELQQFITDQNNRFEQYKNNSPKTAQNDKSELSNQQQQQQEEAQLQQRQQLGEENQTNAGPEQQNAQAQQPGATGTEQQNVNQQEQESQITPAPVSSDTNVSEPSMVSDTIPSQTQSQQNATQEPQQGQVQQGQEQGQQRQYQEIDGRGTASETSSSNSPLQRQEVQQEEVNTPTSEPLAESTEATSRIKQDYEYAQDISQLRTNKQAEKSIRDSTQKDFGERWRYFYNLSYLTPSGKAMQAMQSFDQIQDLNTIDEIKGISNLVGSAMRQYGDQLTTEHENEMFDFLQRNADDTELLREGNFTQRIGALVSAVGFDKNKPLNLNRIRYQTPSENAYDQEVNDLNQQIRQAQSNIEDINSRLNNTDNPEYISPDSPDYQQVLDTANQRKQEYTTQIQNLRQDLLSLRQRRGEYLSGGVSQGTLFPDMDRLTPEEQQEFRDLVTEFTNGEVSTDDIFNQLNEINGEDTQPVELAQPTNQGQAGESVSETIQQPTDVTSGNEETTTAAGQVAEGDERTSRLTSDKEFMDDLEAFKKTFKDWTDSFGNMSIVNNNIEAQAKMIAAGLKLVGSFVKNGVTRFGDIANQVSTMFGERSDNLLRALKQSYAAFLTDISTFDAYDYDTLEGIKFYSWPPEEEKEDAVSVMDKYEAITNPADMSAVMGAAAMSNVNQLLNSPQMTNQADDMGPAKSLFENNMGMRMPFDNVENFNQQQEVRDAIQYSDVLMDNPLVNPQSNIENAYTDQIKKMILNGDALNITAMRKLAQRMGMEEYSDTQLQELGELAVVELSRDIAMREMPDDEKLNAIMDVYNNQPTTGRRSTNRVGMSQYSTPAPMAFVAGLFASKNSPERVLEPSAGNGIMTITMDPRYVHVNEIDRTRLNNLNKQNYINITQQDAMLPFNISPVDAIVMNPPFGESPAIDEDGYIIEGLDEKMVVNALKALKPNGRAAIIIGGHNSFDERGRLKKDRPFFNYLYSHYNVADVINMDGKLFRKQGTSFPTRMILINGVKSQVEGLMPLRNESNSGVVRTFEDLFNRVQTKNIINNEGNSLLQSGVDANTGASSSLYDRDTQRTQNSQQADIAEISTGQDNESDITMSEGGREPGTSDRGRIRIGDINRESDTISTDQGIDAERSISDSGEQVPLGEPGSESGNIENRGEGALQINNPVQVPRRFNVADLEAEKIPYEPKSNSTAIGTMIPTQMAYETETALNELNNRFGSVDAFVMDRLQYPSLEEMYNAFAAEQIDGIAMAINQLENGQGMIIGDMTGIGKGREAAGVLRYAVLQGFSPVFFTERPNLFSDFYRDLQAIGSGQLKPFIVNSKSADSDPNIYDSQGNLVYASLSEAKKRPIFESGKLPSGYDFVMSTYSQMSTSAGTPKKSFITNMANGNIWILDESHNVSGNSNRGSFFQDQLQRTRGTLYLSATYAKRSDNMPVYAMKTAIKDASLTNDELIEAINKGGIALQEVISANLVESGQMIRRERDFTGVEQNFTVLDDLKPFHAEITNKVNQIARDIIDFQNLYVSPIFQQMDSDMAANLSSIEVRKGTENMGVSNTPFASKIFNVVGQLLFSLKAEAAANAAIEELRNNRKPLITFSRTMESFLHSEGFNDGDTIDNTDFSVTLRRGLNGVLRYTVNKYNGDKEYKTLPVEDLSEGGQQRYDEIMQQINEASTGITMSPIDRIMQIIKDSGYSVAEITGRDLAVDLNPDNSGVVHKRADRDINKIVRSFNNGQLDVLLLNQSGATGISLHASPDFVDQRQRHMITTEMNLNIDKEIQMKGRIDRTGNVQRGSYTLITTAIPAENRLLMMYRSKLSSLQANTTSSQRSETNDIDVVDFLNKYGDEVVVSILKDDPELNAKLLDPLGIAEIEPSKLQSFHIVDAARKITSKVAILQTEDQEAFYNEVASRYSKLLEYLNSNNLNDLAVQSLPLNATTISSFPIIIGKGGLSPFGADTNMEQIESDVLRHPLTVEDIRAEISFNTKGKEATSYTRDLVSAMHSFLANKRTTDIDGVQAVYAVRLQKELDSIEAAMRKKDASEEDIASARTSAINRLETQRQKRVASINENAENLGRLLDKRMSFFIPGQAYMIPTNLDEKEINKSFTEGIFLGFGINTAVENPYLPSNIDVRIATNDGRRMVISPMSKSMMIDAIITQTSLSTRDQRQNIVSNWDQLSAKSTRENRYMMTGNLLQAYGVNGGQLVSYTTSDGDIKKGLIMPERYNPASTPIRMPIYKALEYIQNSMVPVVSSDLNISIRKEQVGYSIDVPRSRANGEKYYLDGDLLKLVSGNEFRQMGSKMVGVVSASNLKELLYTLQNKFNTSVDINPGSIPNNQAPNGQGNSKSIFQKAADKMRSMKVNTDNFNSIIPPFNLIPAVWNGAIEIAALSIEGGGKLYDSLRRAYQFAKDNSTEKFSMTDFTEELKGALVEKGIMPKTMSRETQKMAKEALRNIANGADIDAEIYKVQSFFDQMKTMLDEEQDIAQADDEFQMFENYVRSNSFIIPDGASLTPEDALDKIAEMQKGIEERFFNYLPSTKFQKFVSGSAANLDAILNHPINRLMGLPTKIQEKTFGWLSKKVGGEFQKIASSQVSDGNKYANVIFSSLNSIVKNLSKTNEDINESERFKGNSQQRSISDAAKIAKNLYAMLDGKSESLTKIDQLLDPDFYAYLRAMTFEDYVDSMKREEVQNAENLTDAEWKEMYDAFRGQYGFDRPGYQPITYEELSPEEQSAYDMIREVYDYMHEINFAIGKLTPETYYGNFKKYSSRMYDVYELPEDMQSEFSSASLKMDNDLYMMKKELTPWKAMHKMANPVYGVTKRLHQTLANKAVYDYTEYLHNRGDVTSDGPKSGFTKLGNGYFKLSNKYVRNDVVEDFKGYFFSNDILQKAYEGFKKYDRIPLRQMLKKAYTVYNPGVHLANISGNIWFGMLAGINPARLNLNLLYAKDQIDNYKEDYRLLLSEGVIGTDFSRSDLRDENIESEPKASNKLSVLARNNLALSVINNGLDKMKDFYSATDDFYKLAAYHSLRQLGYSQSVALDKIKNGFQNYSRVGKAYDFFSKTPLIGNPFGKFAGDLARIVSGNLVNRPLTTMAFMGSLQAISLLLSQASGESEEERRRRMNRAGVAKIPVPQWFPSWLGGQEEGGISLAWKIGEREYNLAKYISPVFLYSAYDGDNGFDFFQKFSPQPVQYDSYTLNANGRFATIFAKNINDPLLKPFLQVMPFINADFRGMPILDPTENKYKQSNLTWQEKSLNAFRYLVRGYVPHGAYADDFMRSLRGQPDYYGRDRSPQEILSNFMGVKSIEWKPEMYDEVVQKRLNFWSNEFAVQTAKMKSLSNDYNRFYDSEDESLHITDEEFAKREAQILEDMADIVGRGNRELKAMTGVDEYLGSEKDYEPGNK